MLVLGIESSCDETSLAIVENGTKVIAELTYSQILKHSEYGGVVPEIAAREHCSAFTALIQDLLQNNKIDLANIDRIAVVNGPGLASSLLTGVTAAKFISLYWQKEIVAVNHLKAHICANFLQENNTKDQLEPPFICLLASGGHTQLLHVQTHQEIQILGQTLDDSAGEAFDKVARMLGLNYPGGPEIEKFANLYKETNQTKFTLPAKTKVSEFEFSYSGLKTAMLRIIEKQQALTKEDKIELAFLFQEKVFSEMTEKILKASQKFNCKNIAIAGGVSANKRLREIMQEKLENEHCKIFAPQIKYCTDNGAMVASSGYFCPEHIGMDFSIYSRS